MKPWIHEDILKTWTDAQKRLWESLCSAIPLQPPTGVEAWRETYLKNLASWEAAVQRSLEQEAAWVQEWVRRIAWEKGTPEVMASWVRQMEEVLQRWIQAQNQWWSEYFAILRRGGGALPVSTEPLAPAGTTETVAPKPPVGAEPSITAELPLVAPAPPLVPEPTPVAETPVTETPVIEASVVEASAPEIPFAETPVVEVPVSVAEAPVAETPVVEVPVSVAEAPVVEKSVAQPTAPVPESPDDLKLISGIGPALEKKLNACGVTSFRELAALSDADIQRIEAVIKFAGRIRREDWIGQAKARYLQKHSQSL